MQTKRTSKTLLLLLAVCFVLGVISPAMAENETEIQPLAAAAVTDFAGLQAAVNAFNSDAAADTTIEVSGSIDMTALLTVSNADYALTLTGGTLKRAAADVYLVYVDSDAALILEDITLDGAKDAYSANSASLVRVEEGALTLQDGAVLKDNVSGYGGGVYVSGGNSSFTMTGGEISGNTVVGGVGGGVASAGAFTMTGGDITGNAASYGGGAYVGGSASSFEMGGGHISGNTATDGGGGVYAYTTGRVSGGGISGNTVISGNGGGVYVLGGSLAVDSGEISGNVVVGYGGGVFVHDGSFTMTGGLVFGRGEMSAEVVVPNAWTPAEDGTGLVIRWSGADGAVYTEGAATDIHTLPASGAAAVWAEDAQQGGGVSYARGDNTGFIPLPVTVTAPGKQVVTLEGLAIADSVYNGVPHPGYGGSVSFGGGTPTVATLTAWYTGTANNGGDYAGAEPPTNAGSYTVLVTLDDDPAYTGEWTAGFTVGKAASPTPDQPVAGDVTTSGFRITNAYPVAYGLLEYRLQPAGGDYGAWAVYDNDAGVAGLAANTVYALEVRYAGDSNYNESAASTAQAVTTEKETLTGAVAVGGSHMFGETLTVDTAGLTQPDLGALTHQWYRNGTAVAGAAGSTYNLTEADVGAVLNVEVSAAHYAGSVLSTNGTVVAKAPQSAPGAPGEGGRTTDSVTLTAPAGAGPFQYRLGTDGAWQDSPVFGGLAPDTAYAFYARQAETATHLASPAGPGLDVTTDREAPPPAPGLTLTETATGATARFGHAAASGTARLIVTLYSATGTLAQIEQKTFTLSGGVEALSIAFDKEQFAGGQVAAFVWDETDTPLCDQETLPMAAP
ncbi:MAG: hypothetical protein LBK75_01710 [Oscillospiraceae bacterium]|jgi:hypothetical protein|nr:hypothetical protein [Oscillospiraceae bacterium]